MHAVHMFFNVRLHQILYLYLVLYLTTIATFTDFLIIFLNITPNPTEKPTTFGSVDECFPRTIKSSIQAL